MNKNIKLVLRHPSIITKSIFYSLKYCFFNFYKLPILTASKSKIKISKKAKLEIKERIWVGVFEGQIGEIYQIGQEHTVLQLAENSYAKFGEKVAIGPGCKVIVGKKANLNIGQGTMITGGTKILCKKDINIGAKCFISWDVQIMDTDFHKLYYDEDNKANQSINPVSIGNNVWIGSGVKIMKGVKIGNGAVIGAGSIVTRDIPDNSLAVGIPAKVIKSNIKWEV